MTWKNPFLLAAVVLALPIIGFLLFSSHYRHLPQQPKTEFLATAFWQHLVSPGELSQPHAALENNCAACHTPVKGVDANKCMVCHGDNQAVLQRQPTAFHSEIGQCAACHLEHQGRVASTTKMDHLALAEIGFKQLKEQRTQLAQADVENVKSWLAQIQGQPELFPAHLPPKEQLLNCITCHQTKDKHVGFFGTNCASCHGTAKWTIAEFKHPASTSTNCAECHQAPPSHYMMHFKMVSMEKAGMKKAEVNQCFLCHQTTSWNDIKGLGFYKHH